jgi:two-component system, chemotaxis family, CheB/CheR fusion protein
LAKSNALAGYAVAVVSIFAAVGAYLLLEPVLAGRAPFVTLFLAIAFAAWYGGLGPGLLALACGAFAVAWIIMPSLASASAAAIAVMLALYMLVAFIVIYLIGNARKNTAGTTLLAAIVDSSDDAIISKSLEGIIQSWNGAARRIFGYTPEEVIGRHISILFPPDRLNEEDQIVARIRRGERVDHFDTMRVHKDGHLLPVSLTISPVRDISGRIVGASKVARDITERSQMEGDLRRLAADLALASQRKDEFLAMLAHELRNPLPPILNAVNVLLSPRSDAVTDVATRAATARAMHEMIQRQALQLARLVEDLLDVSRITQDRIELRKSRLDLRQIVEHAAASAQATCDAKGQRLAVALPPQPVMTDADAARIAQVVGNLLNNASKFTDRGGEVSLSLGVDGDDAVIRVRDTGVGIAEPDLPRLFNLFTQLDVSLERSQGGLGIGLHLARNLAQMHGGRIEARSAGIGKGAEFEVRLPILACGVPAWEAPAAPAADAPGLPAPYRVLVVDDNRDSASSLAMLLKLAGHEVRTAFDGEQAMAEAEAWRPEVILLDLGLPKITGFEVARRIRELPWGADAQLIALSGWGQEQDRRRTSEAGFDHHLVKPANFTELMEIFSEPSRRESV